MATNPIEDEEPPYEGPVAYLVRGTKRVALTTSSNQHVVRAIALLVCAIALGLNLNLAIAYAALITAALFNR